MRILITGASGFLGRHLSYRLSQQGHQVIPLSRRWGRDFKTMCHMADWHGVLQGVDAVINCVGIIAERGTNRFTAIHTTAPVALFDACVEYGVRRVIQLSALGVDNPSPTPYQSSKAEAERHLQSLPLDWFILRPSLIYGKEGSSTLFFNRLARLPVMPVIARGSQCIQPVHVDDVVAGIEQCLRESEAQRVIDVVGPEAMTFAEWLARLRQQAGKRRGFTVSVPYSLARYCAGFLSPVLPLFSADNLRMLQQGNIADMQPFAEFLGRDPRVVP